MKAVHGAMMVAAAFLVLAPTSAGAAPTVRPWTPPGSDSITTWAATARAGFRAQSVDSITPSTILPYERVGAIARRWFSTLGRDRMVQAPMVESALDSLGFDTELAQDPLLSSFVMLVVRNPHRITSDAVGFFFWFRGEHIQEQAMALLGGYSPRIRVWWAGRADTPYEWGIIEKGRAAQGPWRFSLLQLTSDGGMWRPWQYEGNGPSLGNCTDVVWADPDRDGIPEVLAYSVLPDSLFTECTGCPTLLHQRMYGRRGMVFEMVENQRVPTAYATFVAFIRLLIDRNRAGAQRLVGRPALVDEAFTLGWGSRRAAGTWALEEVSPPRWPDRMIFRFRDGRDEVRYMVSFVTKEGRILVDSWQRLGEPTPGGQKVTPRNTAEGSAVIRPTAFAFAVFLMGALAIVSCERRTTLVARGDSTEVATGDTSRALIRDVQRAWEQRDDLDEAADMTSTLLAEFRRLDPASWVERTEALCDSLGIGVETGGPSCALAVNLFLRSDPGAGSWPYLFWCSGKDVRIHPLEGRNLRLIGAVAREDSGAADFTSFAVLYARSRGTRQEPLLMLWTRPARGEWRLLQTLGPDSLGGTGTAELKAAGSLDVELVARTYRTPQGFEECPTCPHVYWMHRFHWGVFGFERIEDTPIPSPYATFVQFIQALSRGASDPVIHVTDPALIDEALRLDWQSPRGVWRIAPKSEEAGSDLTFFRGPQEAYRVRFVPRDDQYLIAGFEVVPRTVE